MGHIHLYRRPYVDIERKSGSRKTKRLNAIDNRICFIIAKVFVDEQDLQSARHKHLRVDISQRTSPHVMITNFPPPGCEVKNGCASTAAEVLCFSNAYSYVGINSL